MEVDIEGGADDGGHEDDQGRELHSNVLLLRVRRARGRMDASTEGASLIDVLF